MTIQKLHEAKAQLDRAVALQDREERRGAVRAWAVGMGYKDWEPKGKTPYQQWASKVKDKFKKSTQGLDEHVNKHDANNPNPNTNPSPTPPTGPNTNPNPSLFSPQAPEWFAVPPRDEDSEWTGTPQEWTEWLAARKDEWQWNVHLTRCQGLFEMFSGAEETGRWEELTGEISRQLERREVEVTGYLESEMEKLKEKRAALERDREELFAWSDRERAELKETLDRYRAAERGLERDREDLNRIDQLVRGPDGELYCVSADEQGHEQSYICCCIRSSPRLHGAIY